MLKSLFVAAAALTLAGIALPAMAHESTCYSDDQYFVIAHESQDYAGTQFRIRPKSTPDQKFKCDFEGTKSGYLLGENEDPLWYEDLKGQYLITSRSTGPQGDVVVFDLEAKDIVLDKPADEFSISHDAVTYWERVEEGNADNCPSFAENQANFLGSSIIHETVFDFATLTATATGQTKCVATQ